MGFPEDNFRSLAKNYFYTIVRALEHGAISRPYLAKPFVPGNDGWNDTKYKERIEEILDNPDLFLNLDFATLGSETTHPNFKHRLISNILYTALILTLEPTKRNTTYPLIPRTKSRIWNTIAERVNKAIPFDR